MAGQTRPGDRADTVQRGWFWLDGERPAPGEARVSYLGVANEVRIAEPGREQEFLSELAPPREDEPRAGFHEGWVVALGYEFGVALLDIDGGAAHRHPVVAHPDDAPPAVALRVDTVLAIQHDENRAELRGASEDALDAWLEAFAVASAAVNTAVNTEVNTAVSTADDTLGSEREEEVVAAEWRLTDAAYRARVEACRESIRNGDAYVLCLTDTAEIRDAPAAADPLDLFAAFRAAGGPAVRGGVIVAGDRALVSASPERFLSAYPTEAGLGVATHPIKGTRPRSVDPVRDAELADELRSDPKERAENLMIVDLMRNDLSRVCNTGTVAVEGFLRVESHPHVHQLVSTVHGVFADGAGICDAIETCFPGGSMTGAPKRSSVDILAELEPGPRGLYSGCFGWIDAGGAAELAMTIRSVELRGVGGGEARALVGAGGGVTSDSDPERELEEKHLKARSLLGALGVLGTPERAAKGPRETR